MPRHYPHLDVMSDQGGQFPWTSRYVDVGGGVRQAYVDEGPRSSPVTFLLIHGNPTWSFLYRRFIARLAKDFRVVAVDHVGFGRSDKPRDPDYYSLERHITNLGTTLDALGVKNAVPVVQDWGGPIGMGWATRNPDRVAGVVVLNTWAFVRNPPMRLPFLFKFLVHGRGGWRRNIRNNCFVETILGRGGTARKLSKAEVDAYRAPFPHPEDRVGMARSSRMIPETHDTAHPSWATMAAVEDGLPRLRQKPALIVWALRDVAFRKPALERWRAAFDTVDGPHLLPDAKHFLQEDAPDDILAHIQRWAPTVGRGRKPAPKLGTTKPRPRSA